MKRHVLPALAGVLLLLVLAPAQAVEILRWERLPLAVPLVVGQERVVFIDRNVRVGVPPAVSEQLRVQSAGGAIYLRASQPIPPTRLQLQDVESGALILLDIAAEPAKAGQPALEPVRIVEGDGTTPLHGGQAGTSANAGSNAEDDVRDAAGLAPAVVLGFVFAVLLLWGVWAMRTAYVGWAEQRLSQRQFLGVIVRFVAMYLVLGFFLLS